MKILISSMAGADRTDARHFRSVLQRLGHDIVWITSPRIGSSKIAGDFPEPGFSTGTPIEDIISYAGGSIDLFLYLEPYGLIPEGMERASFQTACVLCDMHNYLPTRLNIARFFDHVISYQRNYVKNFIDHPPNHVHWFPIALDLQVFYPMVPVFGNREFDIGFIGQLNTPERASIVSTLLPQYKVNPIRNYLQSEIPLIYSHSKMVLNLPRADDLNYRVFEALSAGALLITKRVDNGTNDLFEEDVHYVGFSTTDELLKKVDYYLSHDVERIKIANAGLSEFRQHHTLEFRLTKILERLKNAPANAAPVRQMTSYQLDQTYTYLYEHWYQLDPILRRIGSAKQDHRSWMHMIPSVIRMIGRYMTGRLPNN